MKIKINKSKNNPWPGTYFTPDEIPNLKFPVFYQHAISASPPSESIPIEQYYYIWIFRKGEKFWQDAWVSKENETLDVSWETYLKSFDLKHNRYFNNNENTWKEYDAVMPRSKVPEGYKDIISVILK